MAVLEWSGLQSECPYKEADASFVSIPEAVCLPPLPLF